MSALFRFRHLYTMPAEGAEAVTPTPVYGHDGSVVGFADVQIKGTEAQIFVAMLAGTPERLDLETQARNWYLDPIVRFEGALSSLYLDGLVSGAAPKMTIRGFRFCPDPGLRDTPISGGSRDE